MIHQKIQELMVAKGQKLVVAESCTGGAVAALLTALPGASRYFLGSIVAYQAEEKIAWLGVLPETIRQYGLVSCEVAHEMAQGALHKSRADYALAVTGSAGPTVADVRSEVGKICFAVVSKAGQKQNWTARFQGTRQQIIEQATLELLNKFYKAFFS